MCHREIRLKKASFDWRDITAMIIVIFLFLSIPFLVFILIVSSWAFLSSLLKFLDGETGKLYEVFTWFFAIIVEVLVLIWLVKWHRS